MKADGEIRLENQVWILNKPYDTTMGSAFLDELLESVNSNGGTP